MADSFIQLPADSTGKKLHTYDLGTPGHDQYVIPTRPGITSAQVMVSTFRIAGSASANHNLFYVENAAGSSVLMRVRRLTAQIESTAVLVTLAPSLMTYKVTSSLATGGTASTKHLFDSADSSSASCKAHGAASADGTGSTITWSVAAGTPGWRQFSMRLHTAVGQVLFPDNPLIPTLCDDDPVILRAGQQLVVQVNIAYATTAHYIINCQWDEFTLP